MTSPESRSDQEKLDAGSGSMQPGPGPGPGAISPPAPPPAGEPVAPPFLSPEDAELLVPRRRFEPIRDVLLCWQETMTAALDRRLWGFGRTQILEQIESFGRCFHRDDAPMPMLWLGIAWGVDDAPETLPSWGASLQVSGEVVDDLERDRGELRSAMERAAKISDGQLGIYRFDGHVELAGWRPMEWLLQEQDQVWALMGFWSAFVQILADAEIGEAVDSFIASTRRLRRS